MILLNYIVVAIVWFLLPAVATSILSYILFIGDKLLDYFMIVFTGSTGIWIDKDDQRSK